MDTCAGFTKEGGGRGGSSRTSLTPKKRRRRRAKPGRALALICVGLVTQTWKICLWFPTCTLLLSRISFFFFFRRLNFTQPVAVNREFEKPSQRSALGVFFKKKKSQRRKKIVTFQRRLQTVWQGRDPLPACLQGRESGSARLFDQCAQGLVEPVGELGSIRGS